MTKILKFYKNDCPPCYALSRLFLQIDIPSNIEIVEMNVGEENNKKLAKEMGVEKVPTLVKENGSLITGKIDRKTLLEFLEVNE